MSSVTETFFPRLKEILDQDPSAAQRLKLECGMCMEDMLINEDVRVEQRGNVTYVSHNAYILPCGHIFGITCVLKLKENSITVRDPEYQCPNCRAPMYFHSCGCLSTVGAVLNTEGDKYQKMCEEVRTLNFRNSSCRKCRLAEIYDDMFESNFEVSGGVQIGPSEMQRRKLSGIPLAMLLFRNSDGWAISEVHVFDRRYVDHEMSDRLRTRLDAFINDIVTSDESNKTYISMELAMVDSPLVGMRGCADTEMNLEIFDRL
ncbi:hypothetical protein HYE68_009109 [Fusarium pseudograminearum]|nr:hypothetical protein HYE68_009109 [Fusarium pseudograminearum]